MRPISSRLLLFCVLALALIVPALGIPSLVAPRVAAAQGDPRVEARTHYQAGMSKFNAGQYDEAVVEFRAAEQLAPSPLNHYNIALALERKGDAAGAIDAYRAYLDRLPNAANRGDVEASIKRLTPAAAVQAEAASRDKAAAEAETQRRLAAEQAEAEAKRRAELEAATRPLPPTGTGTPAPTGDPELDRVASVDLVAMRGAQPLPPPSGAATPPTSASNGAAASPAPSGGDVPKKASRPFYKSPVFWVLAAVGVYVLIVLADDSSDNTAQAGNARLMLPESSPRMSSGPAIFSF